MGRLTVECLSQEARIRESRYVEREDMKSYFSYKLQEH